MQPKWRSREFWQSDTGLGLDWAALLIIVLSLPLAWASVVLLPRLLGPIEGPSPALAFVVLVLALTWRYLVGTTPRIWRIPLWPIAAILAVVIMVVRELG